MKNRNELLALLLFAVLIGINYPVVAAAIKYVNPLLLVSLSYAVGALLVLIWKRNIRIKRSEVLPSLAFGTLSFLLLALIFTSLVFISGPLASFLGELAFLVAALLEWLIFKQEMKPATLAAFAIAIIGLVLILISNGASITIASGFIAGVLLAALGAIAAGLQYIVGSRFTNKIAPAVSSFYSCALVALLAFLAFEIQNPGAQITIPQQVLPNVLYVCLFASGFSVYLQLYGQRKISATTTGLIFLAIPIVSSLAGLAFSQTLNFLQMIGSAMLLIAVAITIMQYQRGKLLKA